jgi:uncharacterized protein
VGAAEDWLRRQGFAEVRVRSQGETARIELPANALETVCGQLACGSLREELVRVFLGLGFNAVALDLEGLVSGKLNRDLNLNREGGLEIAAPREEAAALRDGAATAQTEDRWGSRSP